MCADPTKTIWLIAYLCNHFAVYKGGGRFFGSITWSYVDSQHLASKIDGNMIFSAPFFLTLHRTAYYPLSYK